MQLPSAYCVKGANPSNLYRMTSVALSDIRSAFERYLEAERNLSVHTVRAYMGDLDSFFEHLTKLDLNDFATLELSHIRSWLANQQIKGGARTTLSRRATSIRLFTKWATKKGYLAKDVGATLATPKGARTLPDVLSVTDAATAMDSMAVRVAEEDGPISKRDCAIVEVLYASGARVSELCGLDLDDVLDLVPRQGTACHDPLALLLGQTVNHQHPVQGFTPASRLHQQRYVQHDASGPSALCLLHL